MERTIDAVALIMQCYGRASSTKGMVILLHAVRHLKATRWNWTDERYPKCS